MSEKHLKRITELGAIGEWLIQRREEVVKRLEGDLEDADATRLSMLLGTLDNWIEGVQEDVVMYVQENQMDSDGDWREVTR
jgi:hypothetical protein